MDEQAIASHRINRAHRTLVLLLAVFASLSWILAIVMITLYALERVDGGLAIIASLVACTLTICATLIGTRVMVASDHSAIVDSCQDIRVDVQRLEYEIGGRGSEHAMMRAAYVDLANRLGQVHAELRALMDGLQCVGGQLGRVEVGSAATIARVDRLSEQVSHKVNTTWWDGFATGYEEVAVGAGNVVPISPGPRHPYGGD